MSHLSLIQRLVLALRSFATASSECLAFLMQFYELNLVTLITLVVASLYLERRLSRRKNNDDTPAIHTAGTAAGLMNRYVLVYGIVMGADWLQGPYIYSLYREQYALPERTVALLFVVGFLSAGIAAPIVGVWADQYGRRTLCLTFCLLYTAACGCAALPHFPVLLVGRILGGTSTAILFSAFEAWLIASSNALDLPPPALSAIFGRATLVNGFAAAAAGVASNQLVTRTGSFVAPFMASAVMLVLGWVMIRATWDENHGDRREPVQPTSYDVLQIQRLVQAWHIVRQDPRLLTLGLIQTCFEGSMYFFVFIWVPTLQEASDSQSLPLGNIFSSFMLCMMLGSLLYTTVAAKLSASSTATKDQSATAEQHTHSSSDPLLLKNKHSPDDSSVTVHATLSALTLTASALALIVAAQIQSAHARFYAFCVFEACVGMYFPIQGMLRGVLIVEDHRATLSSLFRVPLNIFVVIALLTGVSSARHVVLLASSGFLASAALITSVVFAVRRPILRPKRSSDDSSRYD